MLSVSACETGGALRHSATPVSTSRNLHNRLYAFGAHDPFHFGVGLQFVELADDARQDLIQFRIRDMGVKAMAISLQHPALVEDRKNPLHEAQTPDAPQTLTRA